MDEKQISEFFNLLETGSTSIFDKYVRKNGETDTFQLLVTKTLSNVNCQFDYEPDLKAEAVEFLGEEISHLNALHVCCFLGEEELAIQILQFVADYAYRIHGKTFLQDFMARSCGGGNTCFHLACFFGLEKLVQKLHDLGANPRKKNNRRYTPIDCANDSVICHMLLRRDVNASLSAQQDLTDLKGLPDACSLAPKPARNLKVKFEEKVCIEDALKTGDMQELKFFIEIGASFDFQNADGMTPLHLASEMGSLSIVKLILQSIEVEEAKKKLLNRRDNEGWTPLHSAAFEGHFEIVNYLLQAGGDETILNEDGHSVADFLKIKCN